MVKIKKTTKKTEVGQFLPMVPPDSAEGWHFEIIVYIQLISYVNLNHNIDSMY